MLTLKIKQIIQTITTRLDDMGAARQKVYIVPTKLGIFYVAINFAAFMMGLVYTNNMALLVSFLLLSFLVVTMVLTNNQLINLEFENLLVADFYTDQKGNGKLFVNSKSYSPFLQLELKDIDQSFKLEQMQNRYHFNLRLARGCYTIKRIKIFSESPAGLFHAWRSWKCLKRIYVYPETKKIEDTPHMTSKDSKLIREEADFSHQIPYQRGMSSKRIDWKTYAKTDSLYWKKHDVLTPDFFHFDLEKLPGNVEERLQYLSFLVTKANSINATWSLKLGTQKIQGTGADFFKNCMQKLAEFQA